MQLGQLPFQGLVKGRIPADVASAAGADAETIHGVFDRVHYLGMSAHAKVVVRAPNCDIRVQDFVAGIGKLSKTKFWQKYYGVL